MKNEDDINASGNLFLTASTVFNDCFIEKVFKTWGWWHHKNTYSPKLFTCNIKSSRQGKVHIPLSTFSQYIFNHKAYLSYIKNN